MVYRTEDLELLNTVVLDVSPAVLVPFYDADSNTLFLTGKGESTVLTFEVRSAGKGTQDSFDKESKLKRPRYTSKFWPQLTFHALSSLYLRTIISCLFKPLISVLFSRLPLMPRTSSR